MNENAQTDLSKVPAVTLIFWIIKILATTLGETGGEGLDRVFLAFAAWRIASAANIERAREPFWVA